MVVVVVFERGGMDNYVEPAKGQLIIGASPCRVGKAKSSTSGNPYLIGLLIAADSANFFLHHMVAMTND